jgi:hypothetical protein
VPATDDEVMEVEDFLEYENSDMRVVADTGQSLECISIERSSSGKLRLECSEGECSIFQLPILLLISMHCTGHINFFGLLFLYYKQPLSLLIGNLGISFFCL